MHRPVLNPFHGTTQVKVVRRRVLQHDLDMFAAIAGSRPALPVSPAPYHRAVKVPTAARAKSWSATVLAAYLGNHMPRFAVRVVRPEISDWVRRLSQQAIERLQEAQARLASARQSRPHPPHDNVTPN